MIDLSIHIEINGMQHLAGHIRGNDISDACFQYDQSYLNIPKILPISISLPLKEDAFTSVETKNYFEGLLPEGFSRKAVANWIKADEHDYISILKYLGQECLGAIQVNSQNEKKLPGKYEVLSLEQVKALAAEGAVKSTQLLMETHLSLTGASGKVGLYYDGKNWYLPKESAASTHIVKQSHVRLNHIVLNEQLCMLTAKKLGIDVPESFVINMDKGADGDILYATKRYDRQIGDNCIVNHLQVPFRLHQEDFAMALGIASSQKYEQKPDGYLKRMFEIVRNYSSDPIRDQLKLWDNIVLNFLIGNTDCHIKNYSLLYTKDMRGLSLAPAYDIVCTRAYGGTKDMSFYIGDEIEITKINRRNFIKAANEISLGEKVAMKHFDAIADNYESAVKEASFEIREQGFSNIDFIEEAMLTRSGYALIKDYF